MCRGLLRLVCMLFCFLPAILAGSNSTTFGTITYHSHHKSANNIDRIIFLLKYVSPFTDLIVVRCYCCVVL